MANELRVTLATAANKPAINKTRESCSKGKYSSSSPFSYSLNLIFPFMNAINSNVYAGWCSAHLGELALAEGHKSAEAGADGARESKIKWISNWFKENLTLRLSSCVFAPPNGRSIGAIVAHTRHVERLINHLNVLKLIKKEHTLWQLPNLNAHPHHITSCPRNQSNHLSRLSRDGNDRSHKVVLKLLSCEWRQVQAKESSSAPANWWQSKVL